MSSPSDSNALSSTDLAHLPSLVAEHWWEVLDEEGDEKAEALDRVTWLAEVLVQYLAAALTADLLAVEPGRLPKPWHGAKEDKFTTLGFGTWLAHCRELAEQLQKRRKPSYLPAFTTLVLDPPGLLANVGRPTPGYRALEALVKLRNEHAHSKLLPSLADRKARLRAARAHFHTIDPFLRTLAAHPLWVATRCDARNTGGFTASVRCLMGDARRPARREIELTEHLQPHEPFFVGQDGALVFAAPLLRCEEHKAHVFHRWEDGPVFRAGREDSRPGHAHSLVELFGAHRRPPVKPPAPAIVSFLRTPTAPEARTFAVPGYEIVRPLGAGGTGQVFLGSRAGKPNDRVALKRLKVDLAADPTLRDRLRREFQVMRRLTSRHAARVHEVVDTPEHGPVLVMEYVEGESLGELRGRGPVPVADAVRLGRQVLEALAEAHGVGIVHRDVKPSNAIRGRDGDVRLLDFGIAHLREAQRLTGSLDALGTRGFAAPEQVAGDAVDGRADLYAVGRLITFLASPGEGSPADYGALPGPVQAVVRRATASSREHRYPDAASMGRELERALTQPAGPPVSPGHHLTRTVRLESTVGRRGPGLWTFYAQEVGSAAPVTVVLAEPHDDARCALDNRVAALRRENSPLFALLSPVDELDGLRFHVLRGRHADGLFGAGGAAPAASGGVSTPAAPPAKPAPPPPARPAAPAATGTPAKKPGPWRPRLEGESVLDALGDWALLGVSILLPPVGIGRVAVSAIKMVSDAVSGAKVSAPPPYLTPIAALPPDLGLVDTVETLDHLALVVFAQAEGRSLKFEPPLWGELLATPLRPTWEALVEPRRWHADVRAHLDGVQNRKELLRALVGVHTALTRGETRLRPEAVEPVRMVYGILRAMVVLGGQGLADGDLGPWVHHNGTEWVLLDMERREGVTPLGKPRRR